MKKLHSHRGFMLIEMMIVLSLLAVFAVAATRLMVLCIRVPNQVGQKRDQIVRFDLAMSRLRQDIWRASTLRCIDAHTLQIQSHGDPDVTWEARNGQISRSAAHSSTKEQWILGAEISFVSQPAGAEVDIREPNGAIDQTDMSSQAMLLEGQSK